MASVASRAAVVLVLGALVTFRASTSEKSSSVAGGAVFLALDAVAIFLFVHCSVALWAAYSEDWMARRDAQHHMLSGNFLRFMLWQAKLPGAMLAATVALSDRPAAVFGPMSTPGILIPFYMGEAVVILHHFVLARARFQARIGRAPWPRDFWSRRHLHYRAYCLVVLLLLLVIFHHLNNCRLTNMRRSGECSPRWTGGVPPLAILGFVLREPYFEHWLLGVVYNNATFLG